MRHHPRRGHRAFWSAYGPLGNFDGDAARIIPPPEMPTPEVAGMAGIRREPAPDPVIHRISRRGSDLVVTTLHVFARERLVLPGAAIDTSAGRRVVRMGR